MLSATCPDRSSGGKGARNASSATAFPIFAALLFRSAFGLEDRSDAVHSETKPPSTIEFFLYIAIYYLRVAKRKTE
jgi:hypothetical protein